MKHSNNKIEPFWYQNEKGRIIIYVLAFLNLLTFLGIHIANIYGVRNIVKIKNNIVKIIDKQQLIQEVVQWIDTLYISNPNIEESIFLVKESFIHKAPKLIDDISLAFMEVIEVEPHFDTKDECYFYFRNTAVKVNRNEISLIPYDKLNGYVLENQIIDEDFNVPKEKKESFFEKFVTNVCKGISERKSSLESYIAYLLHRFRDPSKSKAVILLDETINELCGVFGASGKSLTISSLGFMRNVCEIAGKDFTSSSQFAYQRVTLFTNIVAVNDVKRNQEFDLFYNRVTEGFTINEKFKKEIYIPFERSPKMIIASNFLLKESKGHSTNRRKLEFEYSNYYGKDTSPADEFGHFFFSDWDQQEWNVFRHYMMQCTQQYLQKGLIETEHINLIERRLITEVGIEFIEFMDEQLATGKSKFHKKELYAAFKSGNYVQYRYMTTQRTFTQRLKKYFEYKDIDYVETPKNTKAYIEIKDDAQQSNLITIEDVKTNYKTVETPNMMTRLVNKMKSHFENPENSVLVLDLETTGLDCFTDKIVCLALTFEKGTGYNIMFPKHKTKVLVFLEPILPFLVDNSINKVFHNAKFDLKFLMQYDIVVDAEISDTMIMDYLLNSNRKTHGLKEISKLHLGYKQISFEEMTGGKSITEVETETLTKYACEDTDLTFQLYNFLDNQLNS